MSSIQDRIVGALRVNPATFEEVEHDQAATGQAAFVVLVGGVSTGLATGSLSGAVVGALMGLLGWAVAAFVVLLVGTKLMPGRNTQADFWQVARATGFAQAPYLFGILGIIPILGWLIRLVLWIWVLIALVVAVRQALDYDDTVRAVLVCLVAWAIIFVTGLLVATMGAGLAFMGGTV